MFNSSVVESKTNELFQALTIFLIADITDNTNMESFNNFRENCNILLDFCTSFKNSIVAAFVLIKYTIIRTLLFVIRIGFVTASVKAFAFFCYKFSLDMFFAFNT